MFIIPTTKFPWQPCKFSPVTYLFTVVCNNGTYGRIENSKFQVWHVSPVSYQEVYHPGRTTQIISGSCLTSFVFLSSVRQSKQLGREKIKWLQMNCWINWILGPRASIFKGGLLWKGRGSEPLFYDYIRSNFKTGKHTSNWDVASIKIGE